MAKSTLNRIVSFALIVIMLISLSAVSASAHWGTSRHIHVNLKSHNFSSIALNPHINACTINVYGPSNYFKQTKFSGWTGTTPYKTIGFVYEKAPVGKYRIEVRWKDHSGKILVQNKYGTLTIAERADTYTFQSP